MLHLEVVQEKLKRDYDLDLTAAAPSAKYKITTQSGGVLNIHNPSNMSDPTKIEIVEELWNTVTIMIPDQYLGEILSLCEERRVVKKDLSYTGNTTTRCLFCQPVSSLKEDLRNCITLDSSKFLNLLNP
jgi:GTP-binding protein LepA